MVTKRATSDPKTAKPRAKRVAKSKATDGAAVDSATAVANPSMDPEARRQLVAAEAYFRAERRGFAAGQEVEDWIAAERLVDSKFN